MPSLLAPQPRQLETAPPSALVRVFRDSERDIGYRECLILLDGKEVASVAHRKHVELWVEPGRHVIQATNRVFKSEKIEFAIGAGERRTFQTGNVGSLWYQFFAVMMQLGIPRVFLAMETPEADGPESAPLGLDSEDWARLAGSD